MHYPTEPNYVRKIEDLLGFYEQRSVTDREPFLLPLDLVAAALANNGRATLCCTRQVVMSSAKKAAANILWTPCFVSP